MLGGYRSVTTSAPKGRDLEKMLDLTPPPTPPPRNTAIRKVFWRSTQGVLEEYPRCSGRIPKVFWGNNQDVLEEYPRCSGGVVEVFCRSARGVLEAYPRCSGGVTKVFWRSTQGVLWEVSSFRNALTLTSSKKQIRFICVRHVRGESRAPF